ncbi:MAG: twin-arginine translocase subunit TatC [Muribaculaceae bacterium]|nr:twin-arginine translocase subunit TatC [Muribaculaceae bacterium]
MSNSDKSQQEMGFWDHVDALRGVLWRSVAVIAVFAGVLFYFMPTIFKNVVLAPCKGDFILYQLFEQITAGNPLFPNFSTEGFSVELINIELASQFFIHISTSLWLALILSFPVIFYLLWGFISPALYQNEIKGTRIALIAGNIMFYAGVAVSYFLVFPLTLRFLAEYQISEEIVNTISLSSYMNTFMMLLLLMGLLFELPIVAWLLGKFGILYRNFFTIYRRHAIAALMILAAIVTPTGDPFTMLVVFIPIYALWEASALLVKKQPTLDNTPA